MTDKYLMDGHKLYWHLDRVADFMQKKRIAPLHIDVGLSKGCNIKCHYCFGAIQENIYRKGSNFYFPRAPLLRYMRDAGRAGVKSMGFIGEAEPTLNPYLYEAIVEGTKAGIDIALGTNGILFDTGKPGQAALENLRWIRFNLSAASEEAYRRLHGSKEFSTLIEKIKFCVKYKRKNKLPLTVGVQMVLTPQDVDQAVPLARLGRELGVDYLVIKQCSDSQDNRLGFFKRFKEYESFEDTLKKAERESTGDYNVIIKWKKINEKGQRDYNHCVGAPFLLYSSGDGKLFPCGMFFEKKWWKQFMLGDLLKHSFIEILASDRYKEVIERCRKIDCHTFCYAGCRTDAINSFVWKLEHPPNHVNFV